MDELKYCGFEHLPEEVVVLILRKCRVRDWVNGSAVSKLWKRVLDEMWQSSCLADPRLRFPIGKRNVMGKVMQAEADVFLKKSSDYTWKTWFFEINKYEVCTVDIVKEPNFYVRALYNYEAQEPNELGLHEGDMVRVTPSEEGKDTGWWYGELNGRCGLFPSEFVEVVETPPAVLGPRPDVIVRNDVLKAIQLIQARTENILTHRSDVIEIRDLLTANECYAIISELESGGKLTKSIRNDIAKLERPELAQLMWERLKVHQEDLILEKTDLSERWLPIRVNEQFRVIRYSAYHFPVAHKDGSFSNQAQGEKGLLSLVVYLNDDFIAGETEFSPLNLANSGQDYQFIHRERVKQEEDKKQLVHAPKRGKALLFPPQVLHKSGRVKEGGAKYVLRSDVVYKQQVTHARAVYSYQAEPDSGELTFEEGDILEIVSMGDGEWYIGRLRGVVGQVPSNFLTLKL